MVDVRQSEGSADVLAGRESGKGWLNGILTGLFALRVPLVIGLATVAVLTVPDQMREIHRILTQERTREHPQLALALVRPFAGRPVDRDLAHGPPARRGFSRRDCGRARRHVALDAGMGPALARHAAATGSRARHLAEPLVRSSGWTDINVEDIPENLRAILKQQVDMGGEFTRGVLVCVALAVLVFILVIAVRAQPCARRAAARRAASRC